MLWRDSLMKKGPQKKTPWPRRRFHFLGPTFVGTGEPEILITGSWIQIDSTFNFRSLGIFQLVLHTFQRSVLPVVAALTGPPWPNWPGRDTWEISAHFGTSNRATSHFGTSHGALPMRWPALCGVWAQWRCRSHLLQLQVRGLENSTALITFR